MPRSKTKAPAATHIRGANDNAAAGEGCVTDLGAPFPAASITAEELEILRPLIGALARLAMKRQ